MQACAMIFREHLFSMVKCMTRICTMVEGSDTTAFFRPISIFGTETIEVVPESPVTKQHRKDTKLETLF